MLDFRATKQRCCFGSTAIGSLQFTVTAIRLRPAYPATLGMLLRIAVQQWLYSSPLFENPSVAISAC